MKGLLVKQKKKNNKGMRRREGLLKNGMRMKSQGLSNGIGIATRSTLSGGLSSLIGRNFLERKRGKHMCLGYAILGYALNFWSIFDYAFKFWCIMHYLVL